MNHDETPKDSSTGLVAQKRQHWKARHDLGCKRRGASVSAPAVAGRSQRARALKAEAHRVLTQVTNIKYKYDINIIYIISYNNII